MLVLPNRDNTEVCTLPESIAADQVLVEEIVETGVGCPSTDRHARQQVARYPEVARPTHHHATFPAGEIVIDNIQREFSIGYCQSGRQGRLYVMFVVDKIVFRASDNQSNSI